jgi:hypothetical protein
MGDAHEANPAPPVRSAKQPTGYIPPDVLRARSGYGPPGLMTTSDWKRALSRHRAPQRARRGRRTPRRPGPSGMTVIRPAGPECEHRVCHSQECDRLSHWKRCE